MLCTFLERSVLSAVSTPSVFTDLSSVSVLIDVQSSDSLTPKLDEAISLPIAKSCGDAMMLSEPHALVACLFLGLQHE